VLPSPWCAGRDLYAYHTPSHTARVLKRWPRARRTPGPAGKRHPWTLWMPITADARKPTAKTSTRLPAQRPPPVSAGGPPKDAREAVSPVVRDSGLHRTLGSRGAAGGFRPQPGSLASRGAAQDAVLAQPARPRAKVAARVRRAYGSGTQAWRRRTRRSPRDPRPSRVLAGPGGCASSSATASTAPARLKVAVHSTVKSRDHALRRSRE